MSHPSKPGTLCFMSTLLISHPACLNHLTPPGHPERPDRLRAIERALESEKFSTLAREQAPMAELETVALAHPMDYVEAIREAAPKRGHGVARRRHLDVARLAGSGAARCRRRRARGR